MWRSYYLTFEGPHAKPEIAKKVHESPAAITYVLVGPRVPLDGRRRPLRLLDAPLRRQGRAAPRGVAASRAPPRPGTHFKPYGLGLEYAPDGAQRRRRHRRVGHRPAPLRRDRSPELGRGGAEPARASPRSRTSTTSTRSTTRRSSARSWGSALVLADMDTYDRRRPRQRRRRRRAERCLDHRRHRRLPRRRPRELRRRGHPHRRRPSSVSSRRAASRTTSTASSAASRSSPSSSTSSMKRSMRTTRGD